jgi:hypothetical protein
METTEVGIFEILCFFCQVPDEEFKTPWDSNSLFT